MSLSLALFVSDRRMLRCVCQTHGSDLERVLRSSAPSTAPAGVRTGGDDGGPHGQLVFGYYDQGEVLLSRRPLTETSSLETVLCEAPTSCMLAHVTGPASGGFRPIDAQPFRYRDWLWSQSGTLRERPDFDRRTLAIPSYIRGNLRTWCPEEVVFHLFLSFLHRTGTLSALLWDRAETRRALASATSLVTSLYDGGEENLAPSHSILATNGDAVFGVGVDRPLAYRRIDGIASCRRCAESRDPALPRTHAIAHPHLRAVMLTDRSFEDDTPPEGWEIVPAGTVIEIDGAMGVEQGPLGG